MACSQNTLKLRLFLYRAESQLLQRSPVFSCLGGCWDLEKRKREVEGDISDVLLELRLRVSVGSTTHKDEAFSQSS